MENLQKSELVIAKALGLLMEWGLCDAQLKFEELNLTDDFREYFVTCIEWLEAEGVIRTRRIDKFMDGTAVVVGPTITAHGLALMGKSIALKNSDTTIGEAVQKTSKETAFYTGLGDLGGGFVGGLLKSLGSA